MAERVHANAVVKGFWDGELSREKELAVRIALIHSEISEALEATRTGNPADRHVPALTNLEIELADAVIRIMDMARHFNLRVGQAIVMKHAFNETRPHKHGKAF